MDKPLTSEEYARYVAAARVLKFTGSQFETAMAEFYGPDGARVMSPTQIRLKAQLEAQMVVGSLITGK